MIYSELIEENGKYCLYIAEDTDKGQIIKDCIIFSKDQLIEAFERHGESFVQSLGNCLQCADPINTGKIFDTWKNYVEEYVISYLKK